MSWGLAGWRAVLTGGAGFIGRHLAAQLVEAGAIVVAVDNCELVSYKFGRVRQSTRAHPDAKTVPSSRSSGAQTW
jgi:nucleoside-diphosphate-sugar epimerase